MSKIYQPPGAPFDFQFTDGLENALMRSQSGGSTIGTGVDTLVTIPLVSGLFDINGKSLWAKFFGNINNAAGGNKTITVNFDAILIFQAALGALANSNFELDVFLMRRSDVFVQSRVWLEHQVFTGTSATTNKVSRNDVQGGSLDFNVIHNLVVQGEVTNGADTVELQCFFAKVL